jgi:hypothetical protein
MQASYQSVEFAPTLDIEMAIKSLEAQAQTTT